jgi:hypothetical protein
MKRFVIPLLLAALLSGCIVVPADYGYDDDGGHRWHEHHWNRGGPYGWDRH